MPLRQRAGAYQGHQQAERRERGGEPEQLVSGKRRKGEGQRPMRPAAQYRHRAALEPYERYAKQIQRVIGGVRQLKALPYQPGDE
ncbi:MAG: hypothetical protein RSA54_05525 [Glutamicibacter sp.]